MGVLEPVAEAPATLCSPGAIRQRGLLRPGQVSPARRAVLPYTWQVWPPQPSPRCPFPQGPGPLRTASPPGPQFSLPQSRTLTAAGWKANSLCARSDSRCQHVVGAQNRTFLLPRPPLHKPRTPSGRAISTGGCPGGHGTRILLTVT